MIVQVYGIANCDSVKKARKWLAEHNIDYTFHDYKKEGVNLEDLNTWCDKVGWEVLLNKRGTTWRKLADADKANIDEQKARALLHVHTSMIKRPVLTFAEHVEVGFSDDAYAALLQ